MDLLCSKEIEWYNLKMGGERASEELGIQWVPSRQGSWFLLDPVGSISSWLRGYLVFTVSTTSWHLPWVLAIYLYND